MKRILEVEESIDWLWLEDRLSTIGLVLEGAVLKKREPLACSCGKAAVVLSGGQGWCSTCAKAPSAKRVWLAEREGRHE